VRIGASSKTAGDGVAVEASEVRFRKFLVAGAFLLGVPLLLYVYYKLMFTGLTNPDAMDYAQLGRNLAQGRGFVTYILRPLAFRGGFENVDPLHAPDVTHGPLFPFLLALGFGASSAKDSIAALVSAGFYLLNVPVAYLLGSRVFNRTVGVCAALAMVFSPLMLEYAVSGMPITLVIFLMTSLMFAVFTLARRQQTQPDRPATGWLVLTGVLTGALYLAEPLLFWVVPVVIAAVFTLQRSRPLQSAVAFGSPLLLLMGPWMLRNAALTGNPVFGLRGKELWMHTWVYPEFSGYRTMPDELVAGGELLQAVCLKLVAHAEQVLTTFPTLTGAWLLVFLIPSLLFRFSDPAANALRRVMLFSLLGVFLGSLVFGVQMPLFVALLPVMLVFALAFMIHLTQQAQLARSGVATLAGLLAVTLLLPLAGALSWKPKPERVFHAAVARELGANSPRDEAVLSDQPWLVAWYADRPAFLPPKNDARLKELTAQLPKTRWLFLTEYSRSMSPEWSALYTSFAQWNAQFVQAAAARQKDPKAKLPPSITVRGAGHPFVEGLAGFTVIQPTEPATIRTVIATRLSPRATAGSGGTGARLAARR
jgi:4-amino-4-deoxy-L-arabinose transferase-like glycosyltransferase